jgi:glycosyltransferase involved in cell wall biosynthesis
MAPLYALADALLVYLKSDPLTKVSIPSKTFAYMAAAKPVIMAVKGDAAEFVEQEQFGIAVPPSDPRALADAVRRMVAQPDSVREEMSAAAIRAYDAKYCSRVQIERWADLLESGRKR